MLNNLLTLTAQSVRGGQLERALPLSPRLPQGGNDFDALLDTKMDYHKNNALSRMLYANQLAEATQALIKTAQVKLEEDSEWEAMAIDVVDDNQGSVEFVL